MCTGVFRTSAPREVCSAGIDGEADESTPAGLNTPLIELRGQKPIDVIGTPDEELLRNMIVAIKHGLYS